LDGIPLALELAAARLNVLTAEQVAERLEDAFHFLTGGKRTALPRHQTLQATLDWSYNLLDEKERLLLHRLATFAGGFTLEAAERVCAGEGLQEGEVLDVLTGLVDKSLVIADRRQGEETRYTLLETVHQYAREKLPAEELARLSTCHCEYYCWLAEQAEPRLRSAERLTWTNKMILERHNVQQALEWAFSRGDPNSGLRIIVALARRFWHPHEYTLQTVHWIEEGIKLAQSDPDIPPLMLVGLLNNELSTDTWNTNNHLDEVIALCQQIGPQADAELAQAFVTAMFHHWDRGDKTAVRRYGEQSLEIAQRLQPVDVWHKAWIYVCVGWVYSESLADHGPARQYALEGWRLFQQAGDRWLVTHLFTLGEVAAAEGDYERARGCYREAFLAYREVHDLWGMMLTLSNLASLELRQGDPERARHAARLFGATEAVGFWPDKDKWKDGKWDYLFPEAMKDLRRWLDPAELDAAWAEGAAMTMDEVYAYVFEV
jgi:tetratricopeptide (TPR) repeat protein